VTARRAADRVVRARLGPRWRSYIVNVSAKACNAEWHRGERRLIGATIGARAGSERAGRYLGDVVWARLPRPRAQPGEREELFGGGLESFFAEVGGQRSPVSRSPTQMRIDLEENRPEEVYRVELVGHHRCSMTEPVGRRLEERLELGSTRPLGRNPPVHREEESRAELHQRAAGLLSHPDAVGVGGDPREADASGRELDEEQDVEALQKSVPTVRKSHSRMLLAC
jgi:hypothetical protein